MTNETKKIYKIFTSYLLKVILGGILIGLLYKQQELIAILLVLRIVFRVYTYKRQKIDLKIPIIGMLITGALGTLIEYFGTKYNYWEYHDIDTQLPKYLFFVWMLAFIFMYNIERKVFVNLKKPSLSNKLIIIIGIVLVYPTLGEIITIQLGVWTYYFPYKFLGVSPHTIISIALVHLVINYILSIYCKKRNINDVVLNPL